MDASTSSVEPTCDNDAACAAVPPALLAIAFITTLWSAVLIAAPVAERTPRLSALVYAMGAMVCHQRPERSFHYGEAQYPVCARCLGLYVGAVAGVVAWGLAAGTGPVAAARASRFEASRFRLVLIIAALPTIATVVTAVISVWDPGNMVRAVLAFPLGATIAALVAAAAAGDLR